VSGREWVQSKRQIADRGEQLIARVPPSCGKVTERFINYDALRTKNTAAGDFIAPLHGSSLDYTPNWLKPPALRMARSNSPAVFCKGFRRRSLLMASISEPCRSTSR
jgi:hypothetical protein